MKRAVVSAPTILKKSDNRAPPNRPITSHPSTQIWRVFCRTRRNACTCDNLYSVGGAVQKPGEYKLSQVQALPKRRQNTRHICVEGWDVIGRVGGARISDFLQFVAAKPNAKFLYVECADDYYESLDMASALHPQSLLCYEMHDQPLTREHGAPLRLRVPTKIGYKQAKYLTSLRVTDVVPKAGYWEDQGYPAYYGL